MGAELPFETPKQVRAGPFHLHAEVELCRGSRVAHRVESIEGVRINVEGDIDFALRNGAEELIQGAFVVRRGPAEGFDWAGDFTRAFPAPHYRGFVLMSHRLEERVDFAKFADDRQRALGACALLWEAQVNNTRIPGLLNRFTELPVASLKARGILVLSLDVVLEFGLLTCNVAQFSGELFPFGAEIDRLPRDMVLELRLDAVALSTRVCEGGLEPLLLGCEITRGGVGTVCQSAR